MSAGGARGPCIQLCGVHKSYRSGEIVTEVLSGVDLEIASGELTVVLGASGCGKTTLLNLIGALDVPTSGTVVIDGIDISRLDRRGLTAVRRDKLGFIFQFYNLLPTLTALENVEVGLEILPLEAREIRRRATEYLRLVGLEGKERKFPGQLSGGEQQRVAIARALAREARIVLADEPTGNLDTDTGDRIVELMKSLKERLGLTIVLVTHNTAIAEGADRIVRIVHGKISAPPASTPAVA